MKLLAQRRASVRIGAVIKQQLRERRDLRLVVVVHPKIWLRDHGAKERGMASETICIDSAFDVYVHAPSDQPLGDFHFVVINAHMQKRSSRQRRSEGGERIFMAAELWRIYLLKRKTCGASDRDSAGDAAPVDHGMRLVATGQVVHDHSAPAKLVQIVHQATQQFIDVNAAQAAVMGQHLAASVDRTTGQWEFTTLTVRSWVTA